MVKTRIVVFAVLLAGVMLSCGSFDLMPPEGGTLWVAAKEDQWENKLFIVEPTTGKLIEWRVGCGVGGYDGTETRTGCMTWGDGRLWATGVTEGNEPYWCEIDPETGYAIELFEAPSGSVGGGIAWDGSRLWYTDRFDFYTINPEDQSYEWQFDTHFHGDENAYHDNDALAWDGNYLWSVGGLYYGDIYGVYLFQFDIERKVEVSRVRLDFLKNPDHHKGLTYDGEAFWVTTYRDGSRIYRFSPIDGHSLGYIVPYWVDPVTGEENIIDRPFAVAYKGPAG
jgi:hypothetical protein